MDRTTKSTADLVPLADLGSTSEGGPDLRGWEVWDGDGHHVGRVRELLADPASGRVRALAVALAPIDPGRSHSGPGGSDPNEGVDPTGLPLAAGLAGAIGAMATPGMVGTAPLAETALAAGGGDERSILLPFAAVRLDPAVHRLVLGGLPAGEAQTLPAWSGGPVAPAVAEELERRFGVGEVRGPS